MVFLLGWPSGLFSCARVTVFSDSQPGRVIKYGLTRAHEKPVMRKQKQGLRITRVRKQKQRAHVRKKTKTTCNTQSLLLFSPSSFLFLKTKQNNTYESWCPLDISPVHVHRL